MREEKRYFDTWPRRCWKAAAAAFWAVMQAITISA
jgi:hypothetical protein